MLKLESLFFNFLLNTASKLRLYTQVLKKIIKKSWKKLLTSLSTNSLCYPPGITEQGVIDFFTYWLPVGLTCFFVIKIIFMILWYHNVHWRLIHAFGYSDFWEAYNDILAYKSLVDLFSIFYTIKYDPEILRKEKLLKLKFWDMVDKETAGRADSVWESHRKVELKHERDRALSNSKILKPSHLDDLRIFLILMFDADIPLWVVLWFLFLVGSQLAIMYWAGKRMIFYVMYKITQLILLYIHPTKNPVFYEEVFNLYFKFIEDHNNRYLRFNRHVQRYIIEKHEIFLLYRKKMIENFEITAEMERNSAEAIRKFLANPNQKFVR